jgi:uncharacterized phage-associated protein
MASVLDVAAYILVTMGEMTTMKLQKLVYYCQGWELAWAGEPLFPEPIQAWANGPVSYDLFKAHQGRFRVGQGDIEGDPGALTDEQSETVDAVLDAYGHLTGHQLSMKTHSEAPWLSARDGLEDGIRSSKEVSLDDMQVFFDTLAAQQ